MADFAPGAEVGDAGRYRLRRLIGTGGMASVWLADDSRLRREVAVKVLSDVLALDPDFVARFEREARLAGGLSHPHLVGIYDFSTHGTRPYLVMEYVSGGTLADRLRAPQGAVPDALPLARELLDALDHIHAAGIVHRDIKPANVLIGADGRARLTDFGIARLTDATRRLTSTGSVLGTESYLAPEVRRGEPADARSDLFSLGVLLRECLGAAAQPDLRRLVGLLTYDDPAQRPASAAAALAELGGPVRTASTQVLTNLPGPQTPSEIAPTVAMAEPEPRPPAPPGAKSRRTRIAAAAIALAAVAVTIGVVATRGGDDGAREPLVAPPAGTSIAGQLDALDAAIDRARR